MEKIWSTSLQPWCFSMDLYTVMLTLVIFSLDPKIIQLGMTSSFLIMDFIGQWVPKQFTTSVVSLSILCSRISKKFISMLKSSIFMSTSSIFLWFFSTGQETAKKRLEKTSLKKRRWSFVKKIFLTSILSIKFYKTFLLNSCTSLGLLT